MAAAVSGGRPRGRARKLTLSAADVQPLLDAAVSLQAAGSPRSVSISVKAHAGAEAASVLSAEQQAQLAAVVAAGAAAPAPVQGGE